MQICLGAAAPRMLGGTGCLCCVCAATICAYLLWLKTPSVVLRKYLYTHRT